MIMGFTFKENCPDVRNTKVVDIYKALQEYNLNLVVYDPWANPVVTKCEYNIEIVNNLPVDEFDTLILAVAHDEFKEMDMTKILKRRHVIFDVKGILDRELVDGRL